MKKFKYQSKNDHVKINLEVYSFKESIEMIKRSFHRLVKEKKLPKIINIKVTKEGK